MHAQLVHDNINLTLSTIAHDASDYQTNRLYWTPNPSSFVCEPDALLSLTRLMGLWKICFHWMMLSMLRFTRVDWNVEFLHSALHPKPCWGSSERFPRSTSLLPSIQESLPRSRPLALNFIMPPRWISGYAHGFREQSKLLQMVTFQRKGWKTLR